MVGGVQISGGGPHSPPPGGLEGADRSAAPTTLEPQDEVRGSQRVGAVEREGASEVVSVELLLPNPLSEHYHMVGDNC